MLVLSRRAGEAIVIGEEVRVVVLEVRGEVVRLGIEAPRSVAVHREEVFEQIREENRRAAQRREALDRLFGVFGDGSPRPGDPDPDNGK